MRTTTSVMSSAHRHVGVFAIAAAMMAAVSMLQTAEAGCSGSSFDYMLLEQQWPPTACKRFGCNIDKQFITLHGLWPQDYNNDYPCYCGGARFNLTKLDPIMTQLKTYWQSLKTPCHGNCDASFWSHEWSKHGTCAANAITAMGSELAYFTGALKLRHTYDPMMALKASGITPSDSHGYKMSDIDTAIQSYYGRRMAFECDYSNNMSGVKSCISKSLSLMDCPSNVGTSCSYSHDVYIPASVLSQSAMLRGN